MSQVDREALRAQARAFVDSAAFQRHYQKQHFPAVAWVVVQLIRCATIVRLPSAIRALLKPRRLAFASTKLLDGYRRLADSGRIVRGFLVINSTLLHESPQACAPALVVASLAGSDEGDAIAGDVCGQIVDRIHLEQLTGPADEAVQAMIDDDAYWAFRKRALPKDFTGGREAHLLDVMIDNELLADNSIFGASQMYFLVDPSPRGMILQIPHAKYVAPPSLPTGA